MVIFKNFDRNHIKNLIYFWIHYIYVLKEFYCIHVMRKMLIYQGYWPKIVHGQLPVNEIRVKGTVFDREMIRLSVIGVWFFYWLLIVDILMICLSPLPFTYYRVDIGRHLSCHAQRKAAIIVGLDILSISLNPLIS